MAKQWGSPMETKHISSIFLRRFFKCFPVQVYTESAWGSRHQQHVHGQQSGKKKTCPEICFDSGCSRRHFQKSYKSRQRSVGVRCDYTVPLIISLTPRLLRVTLQERLQSEFCPHYRNSCTQPQHFPRCGNKSPKKNCIGLFLDLFVPKT